MAHTAPARTHALLLAAAAVLVGAPAPAPAREVAGVNLPDRVTVGGRTLALNGAGIRKKFVAKVYAGGLYLEQPATSFEQIVSGDHAWSVRMHFLRDVDRQKVLEAFREGFQNNSRAQLPSLQPGLDRLAAVLPDLKAGNVLVVSYVPGVGSIAGIEGGPSVTIEGRAFGDALLRNWLGPVPADPSLKTAMLGGK